MNAKECYEFAQWATSELEDMSVQELKERYADFMEKIDAYCKKPDGYMENSHTIAMEVFRCLIKFVIAKKERQSSIA